MSDDKVGEAVAGLEFALTNPHAALTTVTTVCADELRVALQALSDLQEENGRLVEYLETARMNADYELGRSHDAEAALSQSRLEVERLRGASEGQAVILEYGGVSEQVAICRCGSFPALYGDGALPDDGYRSLWCQSCMEHVTPMRHSSGAVIREWNALREAEHAALSDKASIPDDKQGEA